MRHGAAITETHVTKSQGTGMTLIELLLAISLAVLVLAILNLAFHSVTRIAVRQHTGTGPMDDLFDGLARELALAIPSESTNDALRIQHDQDTGIWTIDWCFADSLRFKDARWYVLRHVACEVHEKVQPLTFIRKEANWAGAPEQATWTTTLVERTLSFFSMEAYDGQTWATAWDTTVQEGLPDAIRLTWTTKGRPLWTNCIVRMLRCRTIAGATNAAPGP